MSLDPPCKALEAHGDAMQAIGGSGALYAGLSAVSVWSGGAALPAAIPVGAAGGIVAIGGKLQTLEAKYGIMCSQ